MSKNLEEIPPDIRQRSTFLTQEIQRHDHLYYGQNSPEVDDFEYDLLLRELFTLEKLYPRLQSPSSPTQTLSDRALESFPPHQREIPMLSLNNALNQPEALDFWESCQKNCQQRPLDFFVSPKFDGVAVELIYKKGILSIAATRGNGLIGEDITLHIKNISCINKTIPTEYSVSIRGELVLTKQEFFNINQKRAQLNLPLLANSRNATAGMLRSIDFTALKKIQFLFFPYWVVGEGLPKMTTHAQHMDLLKSWGFVFTQLERPCQSFHEIKVVYEELLLQRSSLNFSLDGMVILLNLSRLHKNLGTSGKYPRYAIAWKFPPQIQQTKVLDVFWNIGSKGNFTPVARVSPVMVSGATVRKVTLHNMEYIKKKDIRIGDWVRIVRSGDVIPRILDVVTEKRLPDVTPISIPKECPSCTKQIWEESNDRPHDINFSHQPYDDGEKLTLLCTNKNCLGVLLAKLKVFCGKSGLDIQGLGKSQLELLLKNTIIQNPSDLYQLTAANLDHLPGFGEKKIHNILQSIQSSKNQPCKKLLCAFNISGIETVTAEKIVRALSQPPGPPQHPQDFLQSLRDLSQTSAYIGKEIGKNLLQVTSNEESSRELLSVLHHINLQHPLFWGQQRSHIDSPIAGKAVVFTGTLQMPRHIARERAEKLGAIVSSSITNTTELLIIGGNPGEKKLQKADELQISIIQEETFVQWVHQFL